jgi:hypothetical protein
MKGLPVEILRHADPAYQVCSKDGPSSRYVRALIVECKGFSIPAVLSLVSALPELAGLAGGKSFPVRLVRRTFAGSDYIHAEPVYCPEWQEEKFRGSPWLQFGGNFLFSSDSRFRAICQYPIPIHDRVE